MEQFNSEFKIENALREPLSKYLLELKWILKEQEADRELYCPITRNIMIEPVKASDGNTYERITLLTWLKKY